MEGSVIEIIHEADVQDVQDNLDLEIMRDELEYLELKSDFFDGQTEKCNKLINKKEWKQRDSVTELQELIDEFNERENEKQQLTNYLNVLKDQVKAKAENEALNQDPQIQGDLFRVDRFFNCPECLYKAKFKGNLKVHINRIHHKLKLWKCSDCDKGWFAN